mgnify:CR=1 FL=1
MREQYTKVSHEEVVRLQHETREEITIIDAAARFKKEHKWDLRTLKLKYIIPIIYLLISFAAAVFMVYLRATSPDNDVSHAVGVLDTLSYISRSGPALDIKPITGSQVCDDLGYEPVSLGYWKGTIPGCYCTEDDSFKQRYCFWFDKTSCSNITERPDIDSHTWNGDRFCVLRAKKFERRVGSCSAGYKKCGKFICVDSSDPCPISDVKILADSAATPAGYTARPLTRSKKLVFINDPTSDKEFAQFNISTSTPCLDATTHDKRVNSLTHALERSEYTGCGKYDYNTEAVYLDKEIEKDFFTSNYIYEQIETIPHFNETIDGSDITISAVYRFGVKETNFCAGIALVEVKDILEKLDKFSELYLGVAVGAALLSTAAFCVALTYIRVLSHQGVWITDKEEPFGRRFIVYNVLVLTLFYIITSILGTISVDKFKDRKSYILDLDSNRCFTQENINLAVAEFSEYIKKKTDLFVEVDLLMAILGVAFSLAIGINLLIRRAKKWEKNF